VSYDHSLRVPQDGRILCAALHPAEPKDRSHDGLHAQLASETGSLVTKLMHCNGGRGGHATTVKGGGVARSRLM